MVVNLPGATGLDPRAVERDVATQYEEREGVALDLECDEQMTVEEGGTYECEGSTDDGDEVTITITVTSPDGEYTWSED